MCILYSLFLPTYEAHARPDSTYELWFDEFMSFWRACYNSPPFEPAMMSLYSRLAGHNIGFIDWEPYISTIFTRLLNSFQLPVIFKNTRTSAGPSIIFSTINRLETYISAATAVRRIQADLSTYVGWIAATLGNSSSTMKYLAQMFEALDSYYHPANVGRHSHKLAEFAAKLTNAFARRVHRERYSRTRRWGKVAKEGHRLSDDDVTEFVGVLKPVALHLAYSKVGLVEATSVLQVLASLRPEMVLPTLLERMQVRIDCSTVFARVLLYCTVCRAPSRP